MFLLMLFAYCAVAGTGMVLHAAATPEFVVADLLYVANFAVVLAVGVLLYPRGKQADAREAGRSRAV